MRNILIFLGIYIFVFSFVLGQNRIIGTTWALKSDAKMRFSNSAISSVIYHIPAGTKILVLSEFEGGYYKVKYKGRSGYIHQVYFESSGFVTNKNKSLAKRTNLPTPKIKKNSPHSNTLKSDGKMRVSNSAIADVIFIVPAGTDLNVISNNEGGYCKVQYRGRLGYIHSMYFKSSGILSKDKPVSIKENAKISDKPSAPADLRIDEISFDDSDGNSRIDAREITYISFTLRNKGNGSAKNMKLETLEINGVNGLEFNSVRNLGTLASGARKKIKIQVKGGKNLNSDQAEFKIQIKEQNGFDSRPIRISVTTQAFLEPEVAIVDFQFSTSNGVKMQLGVPVNLKMVVQNRGQGKAEEVKLQVNVPENVFSAGEAVFSLGTINPGESKIIDYEFFTNRRYEKSDVSVYANITERYGKFAESKIMKVALDQQLDTDSRLVIQPGLTDDIIIEDIQLKSDVDMNLPKTRLKNPDAIAVIIGNKDYVNHDVPNVEFALQDALSMKRYLIEVFGYDENNIIYLLNATQADFNGTFGTFKSEKARLFNLVKPGKSDVFVYYSGHGAPDIAENAGYFVPVNCDPSLVKFNGYSMNIFYQNLSKIPYRSLTVVIDACFSGASDKGSLLAQTSLARVKSESKSLNDPNAIVLTAATGDQVASWYPDQSHSLFTYYFLKALQGEANTNNNHVLTFEELKSYLDEKVPYMARRLKNRIQTPEANGRSEKVIIQY